MHKKRLFFLTFLSPIFLIPLSVVPLAVHATTVHFDATKISRCVTKDTKNLHAGTLARYTKDITPFLTNQKTESARQAYTDSVTLAWEAMEQPYCGFGSPGASSARRSYIKTIQRARTAFLRRVSSSTTIALDTTSTTTPIIAERKTVLSSDSIDAPKDLPKPVRKQDVAVYVRIPPGLRRGMTSTHVRDLQHLLLSYFHLSPDDATTYFGPRSQDLLIRFQLEKNLIAHRAAPGAGQVGPRTATALNNL